MYVSVHSLLRDTQNNIRFATIYSTGFFQELCACRVYSEVIAQKPHHSHISSPSAEITYNLILHTGVLKLVLLTRTHLLIKQAELATGESYLEIQ